MTMSVVLPLFAARSDEHDPWDYSLSGGTVEILSFPRDITGAVVIPEEIAGSPVTAIGERAFQGCRVSEVVIPSTVREIGSDAFRDCEFLVQSMLPEGIRVIEAGTFDRCSRLVKVDLPDQLVRIEREAFSSCSALAAIDLPGSLAYLGHKAFAECSVLKEISVPGSVSAIEAGTFAGCSRLVTVDLPERLVRIEREAFYGCSALAAIDFPGSLAYLGHKAFAECSVLKEIAVPGSVYSIELGTFRGCTSLKDILIGEGVGRILHAFQNCSSLEKIRIPASATLMSAVTFSGVAGLREIVVHPANEDFSSKEGILFNASGTELIRFPEGKEDETYKVPEGIVSIAYSAFYRCDSLANITLPASVSSIGAGAFSGCTALREIVLPPLIEELSNHAFRRCTRLEKAFFLGDAPREEFGWDMDTVFIDVSKAFVIYYLSSSKGFTRPIWEGYRTERIDVAQYPAAAWLLRHAFAFDTDLEKEMGRSGEPLLIAFAMGSDPTTAKLAIQPIWDSRAASVVFPLQKSREEIAYMFETSADLQQWHPAPVVTWEGAGDNRHHATITLEPPMQYVRLRIALHSP